MFKWQNQQEAWAISLCNQPDLSLKRKKIYSPYIISKVYFNSFNSINNQKKYIYNAREQTFHKLLYKINVVC